MWDASQRVPGANLLIPFVAKHEDKQTGRARFSLAFSWLVRKLLAFQVLFAYTTHFTVHIAQLKINHVAVFIQKL